MNEKIINKIKKMFALANNEGAAPGEAENAMRMANKLMEKHALTSIDLHTSEEMSITFIDKDSKRWVGNLYNSIVELYSCDMFFSGDRYVLVGAESDMVTAGIVADGLIKNIKRASKGKTVAFSNGAVSEIAKQCKQLIKDRQENLETIPGTGTSLSLVYRTKIDKVRDFMDDKFNLKSSTSRDRTSAEGRDYGATLNPHANLSNKRALN